MRTPGRAALLATLLGMGCATTQAPQEWDGLVRVQISGLDHAYVRPDASLADYTRLMIDPVEVSFSKRWDPRDQPNPQRRLRGEDLERIRREIGQLVREGFVKELQQKGGYPVVEQPGPDVLRVTLAIAELYITAPDVKTPGRDRVYTSDAGQMTLLAELRDSETGQVLARAADTRDGRAFGWRAADSVSNSAEARYAVAQWARILHSRWDAARAAAARPR
jgi:hypothetical protein